MNATSIYWILPSKRYTGDTLRTLGDVGTGKDNKLNVIISHDFGKNHSPASVTFVVAGLALENPQFCETVLTSKKQV